MPNPMRRTTCDRRQIVCRACDAMFLFCVCDRDHTVTYVEMCRRCPPAPGEDGPQRTGIPAPQENTACRT
jgi:hypothetical protein